MMPQSFATAVSTNSSAEVSTPRSMTSMPLPSIIIFTRFLPMSCISPLTVPRQARPTGSLPSPAMSGFKRSITAFMQRAAMSISGTKARFAEKASPSRFMPWMSPSERMAAGAYPSLSASSQSASSFFCCPCSSAAEMRPMRSSGSPVSAAFCTGTALALSAERRGTGGRMTAGTCRRALYSSTA